LSYIIAPIVDSQNRAQYDRWDNLEGMLALQQDRVPTVAEMSSSQRRRRQAILDVALRLVAEHGSAVEIRDIAEKSDVAIGTVYRYFESKDALCCEAFLVWRLRHLVEIEASAAAARSNAGRLRAAMRKSLQLLEHSPKLTELGTSMSLSRDPSIFESRDQAERKTRDLYRRLLIGVPRREADTIVSTVMAVFYFSVLRWAAGQASIKQARKAVEDVIRLTVDDHATA
jgi:TetR/AcrR family transcriptional regulator, cholesterol catabolism regulator